MDFINLVAEKTTKLFIMKNILFPTDFSECSDNALRFAIKICKQMNGTLHLTNIFTSPQMDTLGVLGTDTMDPVANLQAKVDRDLKVKSEKSLDSYHEILNDAGIKYANHALSGDVSHELIGFLSNNSFDLIIMGTEGDEGCQGVFDSSVASLVVEKSDCPVFIVPQNYESLDLYKIVYTTALRDYEDRMVDLVIQFATMFNAEIIFVHVNDGKGTTFSGKHFLGKYPKSTFVELEGDVFAELFHYIDKEDINLVCTTSHSKSFLERLFHKSFTKELSLNTDVPMLAFNENIKTVSF